MVTESAGRIRVRLLGPLDVLVDGVARPVSGPRRTAVLAALALRPGEVLSIDDLVEIVWGDDAPPSAVATLHSHIFRLRRDLGERDAVRARPPGYVLDLGDEGTDVQSAQLLLAQADRTADLAERARLVTQAVALWRGRPLATLTGLAWFDQHDRRLEDLLLRAQHTLIDTRLALGEHRQLIPELDRLIHEHPLNEPFHAQRMLALYRAGRQGDALAAYQDLRGALADQLGVDPNQRLRDLETAILKQDPALDSRSQAGPAPGPDPTTARRPDPVPAQLPAALPAFAGRARELGRLDQLAAHLAGDPGSAAGDPVPAPVVVISGPAGIGKTTLAVHWGRQIAHHFPDGQLYLNLGGFDPTSTALDPTDAIRGLLDALAIPADRIPATAAAQTGLYRSLLAGRRVLIVLDNARTVDQARPLLPAATTCLTIITSRNELAGLSAVDGAFPISLDLPTSAEARDLLSRRLGRRRVEAEPAAVDAIIARCARLPLALAVVAARATSHPHLPLAALATELDRTANPTDRLDALDGGDPSTDVRAVFSWSYRTLTQPAARLFRLLSQHPGPDISEAAAASLTGASPQHTRPLLAELTRAHLLAEHAPRRYACHDLLRVYAAELNHPADPAERHSTTRLLDHYLHTAHAAAVLVAPTREPLAIDPPAPGTFPEQLTDHQQALDWLTAEHRVLLEMINHAQATGRDLYTFRLAWTVSNFLNWRGYSHDWAAAARAAVAAAERVADPAALAGAHRMLGSACTRLDQFAEAHLHFDRAAELHRVSGDHLGHARTQLPLAHLLEQQGRFADALDHARQALESFQAAGERGGQARALSFVGWYHTLLGDHERAIAYCQEALAMHKRLGDRYGQASTCDSIGFAHYHLGRDAEAITWYERALDLLNDLGDHDGEASVLSHLGDARQRTGDVDAARAAWRRALAILDEHHQPEATQIRAKLNGQNPAE